MRKIFKILMIGYLLSSFSLYAATNNCGDIDDTNLSESTLGELMDDCQPVGVMEPESKQEVGHLGPITLSVKSNDGYKIVNAKQKIYSITQKAVILATILAIGGLVYAGILFTTSYGDDTKNKKAKEAIKYSLIGLLVAIISQQLVNAVINFIYGISG